MLEPELHYHSGKYILWKLLLHDLLVSKSLQGSKTIILNSYCFCINGKEEEDNPQSLLMGSHNKKYPNKLSKCIFVALSKAVKLLLWTLQDMKARLTPLLHLALHSQSSSTKPRGIRALRHTQLGSWRSRADTCRMKRNYQGVVFVPFASINEEFTSQKEPVKTMAQSTGPQSLWVVPGKFNGSFRAI